MRYDLLRRVLVVVVVGLIISPAALFPQQNSSLASSAHLSSISGHVTVQRPGATGGVSAQVNAPIAEGSEVLTSEASTADVDLGNGATVRLSELTKAQFTQLGTEPNAGKACLITLEQGNADFHFIPEHNAACKVNIADAKLTPYGKAEIQTLFSPGKVRVEVVAGTAVVSAGSNSVTLGKGKALVYHPPADAGVAKSHARVVRLSYESGTVMVKRPGSAEEEKALVNSPIQEGFELSTSSRSYAEVEFENGSTARLGEQSKLLFHQLALDGDGNKLNGMTFEQGYATFHFEPQHHAASSGIKHDKDGTIYLQPSYLDVNQVRVADATVTPEGKSEFRTDLDQDRYRVEVFNGSVDVATPSQFAKITEGKVLEHQSGSAELALDTQKGIVKDAWDQWAEARDKQVELAEKDTLVHSFGPTYGFSELDTYGEWLNLPGGRHGWAPYSASGWTPYTYGMWQSYPGFGPTWVSSEPWGWLPYHCGYWDFDNSFGWYWAMPFGGCGYWWPARVNWYSGGGLIAWAPTPKPVTPGVVPGRPRPGPGRGPGNIPRGLTVVKATVVQNRQMITPQVVSHTLATSLSLSEGPHFEPTPQSARAATLPQPGAGTRSASDTMLAARAPAPGAGPGLGFASRFSTAPPTILMGGNAARESKLLADHARNSGHQPLLSVRNTTLGGRYFVGHNYGGESSQEFRGHSFAGREGNGTPGGAGDRGMAQSSGGSGATAMSRGSNNSGGGSGVSSATRGSYGGGGGWSGGGGGFSGGGHAGGGGGGGGGHGGGGGGGGGDGGGHH